MGAALGAYVCRVCVESNAHFGFQSRDCGLYHSRRSAMISSRFIGQCSVMCGTMSLSLERPRETHSAQVRSRLVAVQSLFMWPFWPHWQQ